MTRPFLDYPWLAIFALFSLGSIGAILHFITRKKGTFAFFASCLSIFFLLLLFAIGTFPYFVISSLDPSYSLTLFNSSATQTALTVLVIVAAAGLPLAFFYGAYLYKVFRGKVKLDHMSY
jgi:cytochrome d ubiquinol oxidase subunit II